jgi:hypothetical protein
VVAAGLSSGEPVNALLERARKIAGTMATENGLEFHPRDGFSWVMYTAEDEYAFDRLLKAKVLGLTIQDPVAAGERALMGLARFWYLGRTTRATWVSALIHIPLLLLATIGAVRAIRGGAEGVWLWVAIIGYFNVIGSIILPLVRYATPVMPFVVILAASLAAPRARILHAATSPNGPSMPPAAIPTVGKMAAEHVLVPPRLLAGPSGAPSVLQWSSFLLGVPRERGAAMTTVSTISAMWLP